ncbi:MAG: trypsin-like serine protease, partial [Myxococcales bacterium]|nr:trypsin-like serine protease [Myxococcales bacterium]
MHLSKRIVLWAPLALACAPACSGSDPSLDPASMLSSPIQGGTNDTTHSFAVGVIVSQGNNTGQVALCSGALLAPNLVATARHCVAALTSTAVNCSTSMFGAVTAPGNVTVTTDADLRTRTTRFRVSQIVVPSGANQTSVCGNDLALLILSQN